MTIGVVDYGIGNLYSCFKAIEAAGGDVVMMDRPQELVGADALVVPGVGDFGACVRALRQGGFEEPLREMLAKERPILGICVGMQMLFEGSDEAPGEDGLGILPGRVRQLGPGVRLPQMQWNALGYVPSLIASESNDSSTSYPSLFRGLPEGLWVYFVHSYGVALGEFTTASSCYGDTFSAAVQRGLLYGTQFHPEKSSSVGLSILRNFVEIVREMNVKREVERA